MSNHVHLVIDPGVDVRSLSVLMKRLAGRHTRRLNRLHGRTGSAWEGRFKCSPIETDSYLLACARYDEETGKAAGVEEALWDVARFSDAGATLALDAPRMDTNVAPQSRVLH